MKEIYTLKCLQGHPYFGNWITIDVFSDKEVAEDVCRRAQARHAELGKRFPKDARLTGLNPFDPGYSGPWTPTRYFVEASAVLEKSPADTLNLAEITVLEKSDALPIGSDFIVAGTVELNLAGTRISRESSPCQFELYDPVPLLRVSYKNQGFTLFLTDGLTEVKRLEPGQRPTYFPVCLDALSEDERATLRSGDTIHRVTGPGRKIPGGVFFSPGDSISYFGKLRWLSDAAPDFSHEMAVLPGTLPEILSQLVCILESWQKSQASAQRQTSDEFYAAWKTRAAVAA